MGAFRLFFFHAFGPLALTPFFSARALSWLRAYSSWHPNLQTRLRPHPHVLVYPRWSYGLLRIWNQVFLVWLHRKATQLTWLQLATLRFLPGLGCRVPEPYLQFLAGAAARGLRLPGRIAPQVPPRYCFGDSKQRKLWSPPCLHPPIRLPSRAFDGLPSSLLKFGPRTLCREF